MADEQIKNPSSSPQRESLEGEENHDATLLSESQFFGESSIRMQDILNDLPVYEVDKILGQGTSGIVLEATHKKLGRKVAIKMLRPRYFRNQNVLENFRKEAQIISRIKHENIASVYDFIEVNGRHYIVMEFIKGQSLKDLIDGGLVAQEKILPIMLGIFEGIRHSHNKNILHLDLKPSNIIINEYDIIVIVDFGLSRFESTPPSQEHGHILGTPHYMAPEQYLKGQRLVETRSDLYSAGVIFYQLLTGCVPFSGYDLNDIRKKVLLEDPVKPGQLKKNIHPDLEAIVLKLLSKQPSGRYSKAQSVIDDIRRFQNGEPVKARTHRLRTYLWNWVRRNLAISLLSTLVLIVAITFLVFFNHIKNQETPQWNDSFSEDFNTFFNKRWLGYEGLLNGFVKPIPTSEFEVYFGNRIDVLSFKKSHDLMLSSKQTFDDNIRLHFKMNVNPGEKSRFGFFLNSASQSTQKENPDELGYIFEFSQGKLELRRDNINNTPLWSGQFNFDRNKVYDLQVAIIDGHIELLIDHQKVVDFQDFVNWFSKKDYRFGFFSNETDLEIDDVKLFQLNTALLITPLDIGNRFFQLARFEDAFEEYTRVITKYPDHKIAKDAYYFRGLALMELERFNEAIKDFEHLINKSNINTSLRGKSHYQKGVCLLRVGQIEEGCKAFDLAMKSYDIPSLSSHVINTLFALGMEKMRDATPKKAFEAETLFRFLIQLNIPSRISFIELPKKILLYHFEFGNFDKSIEILNLLKDHYAAKRDLVAFTIWKKGRAYIEMAQNQKGEEEKEKFIRNGVQCFERILKEFPEIKMYSYFSCDELAKLYRKLGEYKKANDFERKKLKYHKQYGVMYGE